MATLIRVGNSEGEVGRCDAKCYNADEVQCDCVCGGLNHGAGEQRATVQTGALARSWIESYAERKGIDAGALQAEIFGVDHANRSLFEGSTHE
jgi:hypothetical protein